MDQTISLSLARDCQNYSWPQSYRPLGVNSTPAIDAEKLDWHLQRLNHRKYLIATVVSFEYVDIAITWYSWIRRLGISDVVIFAFDRPTADMMREMSIPHVEFRSSLYTADKTAYRNPGGFDLKGMSIIHDRIWICQHLISRGANTILCDVDAILVKNPRPYINSHADLTFQRVVYFPEAAVSNWGFAACGGFVAYKASNSTRNFLSHLIESLQLVSSDQLSINRFLLENSAHWDTNHKQGAPDGDREAAFQTHASKRVIGNLKKLNMRLEALPADVFWRHSFVPLRPSRLVLIHPNSPKNPIEKMKLINTELRRYERMMDKVEG
jgi:hypothetical protein